MSSLITQSMGAAIADTRSKSREAAAPSHEEKVDNIGTSIIMRQHKLNAKINERDEDSVHVDI